MEHFDILCKFSEMRMAMCYSRDGCKKCDSEKNNRRVGVGNAAKRQ